MFYNPITMMSKKEGCVMILVATLGTLGLVGAMSRLGTHKVQTSVAPATEADLADPMLARNTQDELRRYRNMAVSDNGGSTESLNRLPSNIKETLLEKTFAAEATEGTNSFERLGRLGLKFVKKTVVAGGREYEYLVFTGFDTNPPPFGPTTRH
jgi:hypothetical protein